MYIESSLLTYPNRYAQKHVVKILVFQDDVEKDAFESSFNRRLDCARIQRY